MTFMVVVPMVPHEGAKARKVTTKNLEFKKLDVMLLAGVIGAGVARVCFCLL